MSIGVSSNPPAEGSTTLSAETGSLAKSPPTISSQTPERSTEPTPSHSSVSIHTTSAVSRSQLNGTVTTTVHSTVESAQSRSSPVTVGAAVGVTIPPHVAGLSSSVASLTVHGSAAVSHPLTLDLASAPSSFLTSITLQTSSSISMVVLSLPSSISSPLSSPSQPPSETSSMAVRVTSSKPASVAKNTASPPPPPPASSHSTVPSTPSSTPKAPPATSAKETPAPPASSSPVHVSSPSPSPSPSASAAPKPSSTPIINPSQASNPSTPRTTIAVLAPTSISTVTEHPETTLSSPLFESVTNSAGHVTISEPPIFTSIGTTISNGELISVTHVIANPTGIWGVADQSAITHGFFSNTGAVAGVFLVVGIVVALIIAIAMFFVCKARRRERIRYSISRPLPFPNNPFEDPRESPTPSEMRYASDASHRGLVGSGIGINPSPTAPRNLLDDEISDDDVTPATIYRTPMHPMQPQLEKSSLGLTNTDFAGVGAGGKSLDKPPYNGPFSDLHPRAPTAAHGRKLSERTFNIGVAITTEEKRDTLVSPVLVPLPRPVHSRRSSVQSSPSIYPASLPPEPEVSPIEQRFPMLRRPLPTPVSPVKEAPELIASPPPVIPPRNPLRTSQLRAQQLFKPKFINPNTYEPMTPPASLISSHSQSSSVEGKNERPLSGLINPFSDFASEQMTKGGSPLVRSGPANVGQAGVNTRENFYTRRKNLEVRPSGSLEWKNSN